MQLTAEIVPLRTHHPFVIARGGSATWQTVWVKVTDTDGVEGWGEAAPSRFYGETASTVIAALDVLKDVVAEADAWSLEATEAAMALAIRGNPAARVAVSTALHDLAGKRLGVPLWKLWGLTPSRAPRSSFTIGIAPLDVVRQRVVEAAQYPILKVKLGSPHDAAMIRAVREAAPDKVLRVDANCAWTPKKALAMIPLSSSPCRRRIWRVCGSCASVRRCRSSLTSRAWSRRTSRGSSGRWTGSTSSWPSADRCWKRAVSSTWRARIICA